jgi:hypothetical protein
VDKASPPVADPQIVVAVLNDAGDVMAGEADPAFGVGKRFELIPVVAVQAALGSQPEESAVILVYGVHDVMAQSVFDGKFADEGPWRVGRLCGYGEAEGQQAQHQPPAPSRTVRTCPVKPSAHSRGCVHSPALPCGEPGHVLDGSPPPCHGGEVAAAPRFSDRLFILHGWDVRLRHNHMVNFDI